VLDDGSVKWHVVISYDSETASASSDDIPADEEEYVSELNGSVERAVNGDVVFLVRSSTPVRRHSQTNHKQYTDDTAATAGGYWGYPTLGSNDTRASVSRTIVKENGAETMRYYSLTREREE
jgi:hypothetical protein